ncbi:MAG: hypothetical protein Q8Q09_05590 [Deltaproteobacteria bacterium]|nr:hypothetical protein [Deltaproteobacteria bacterium]
MSISGMSHLAKRFAIDTIGRAGGSADAGLVVAESGDCVVCMIALALLSLRVG